MDGLRLVLLIAGIVFVLGIYLYARFSRRNDAVREEPSGAAARDPDPGHEADGRERDSASVPCTWPDDATHGDASESPARDPDGGAGSDRKRRGMFARVLRRAGRSDGAARRPRRKAGRSREPHTGIAPHSLGGDYDVNDLGGVFAPKREMPGAELSIDLSVLAGLRATYESTMDGLAPPADAEITDAGITDTGITDAGMDTEGGPDLDVADAGAADFDSTGASIADTGAMDIGAMDIGAMDAGTMDAGATDVGATDVGATDVGAADVGAPDADPVESAAAAEQPALDLSRPIVHLLLLAKGGRLSGRAILDALDAEGFHPGAMQLYYWRSDRDPSIAFGVANLVEPGALDPESLPDTETPGLVAFMCVPSDAAQAREILDAMIGASRRLAHRLDAALRDEARSTLSTQAENHLREKVTDIARRSRLKGG